MRIENITVNYHRNGIGGAGFFACLFDWYEDGESLDERPRKMMGTVFMDTDEEGYSKPYPDPHIAVYDTDLLPDLRFMHNSWRGDHFAPALYEAIKAYEQRPMDDLLAGIDFCYTPHTHGA